MRSSQFENAHSSNTPSIDLPTVLGNRFVLPGAKVHYARDRSYHTKHVKLGLSFDFAQKRLFGKASITFSPISDGLRELELDAVELNVKAVSLGADQKLEYDVLAQTIRVHLPRPLDSTEEETITIAYEATPRRGLYFKAPDDAYPERPVQIWTQGEDEDSRYWFPCYDYPNDRATSEMVVTVPKPFTAISNGKLILVQEDESRGSRKFHWRQDFPHPVYLTSLVVGEFSEITDRWKDVPVQYYVPFGREEEAKRNFEKTPSMMEFFSEKTGVDYPYWKYSLVTVADFIWGGMENISATTLTERTLHDERAHLDYSSEPLLAHELAHQWFGDLITCKDWSHVWTNEGFAEYFKGIWREHELGEDEFQLYLLDEAEQYFVETEDRYGRPIVCKVYHDPQDLFDAHTYEKAALVLHMLRFVLGEDLFWKAVRDYVRKHQGQCVETDDFRKAVEESTGRNLEWFFEQWFYKPGHPEFKVDYQWDAREKTVTLRILQTQDTSDGTPFFQTPAEVSFVTSSEEILQTVYVAAKESVLFFRLPDEPKSVVFDPRNWLLKKIDFPRPKDMLVRQLMNHSEAAARIDAAKHLAKTRESDVVEVLKTAALTDPFWGVQAEAALALGEIGTKEALHALLECLKVKHPKARRWVVRTLGEFRDEEAAEALLPVLENDESYFVEAEAARSLGRTLSTKAFDALVDALQKDSYDDVIRTSVFGLERQTERIRGGFAELADARAIPVAFEYTRYGKQLRTRESAVACLGRIGKDHDEVASHVISLLDDPWFGVRFQAARALDDMNYVKGTPELERALSVELEGRVRRRIREALYRLKSSASSNTH